jgi:hypothetical protein
MHCTRITTLEDQPMATIWRARHPDIVPEGEVRPAIPSRFMASAEPQTRLYWG